jgi:MoaA/NifB/PqqE/SkfB family radical SAM enzyme
MTIGEFGGYLSAEFPSQIVVDVTQFCNLACTHCPYESVTKPKGKERKNLNPSLHAKLVHEVGTDGVGLCKFVRYSGDGEPLLNPHLMEFLSAMHGASVTTTLTTNGLLLTDERCRELIETGVDVVDISLDPRKPQRGG